MTGSAAAKVTQTYHLGGKLSNVIYRRKDLLCNLSALAVDAKQEYIRLNDPILRKDSTFMKRYPEGHVPMDMGTFLKTYMKENVIRAIKCSHDFHFVKYFKPAVLTTNAYGSVRPIGVDSLLRGRKTKATAIVRFDPSAAFTTDMGLRIRVKAPPRTVIQRSDSDGNLQDALVRWRWCDFPGIRLIDRAEAKFTQSEVEEYRYWDIMNETASMTDENLREAWYRCVGHDTGIKGKLFNVGTGTDQEMRFFQGYQTLKPIQEDLDLFVPLRFFFNKDIGSALQITNLDSEQLEIHFDLAKLEHLIEGQVDPVPATAPRDGPAEIFTDLPSLQIDRFELQYNNIFVDECIHDQLLNQEIYNVVTIRQQFTKQINQRCGQVEFDKIRFLLEDVLIQTLRKDQEDGMETWWRDGIAEETDNCGVAVFPGDPPQLVTRPYTGYSYSPLFSRLKLTTKGENIIDFIGPKFYQEYLHFVRGQQQSGSVVTMPETHRLLYTWAQRVNDPTAVHSSANLSREREVFLEYEGLNDAITRDNPAVLNITAHVKAVVISSQGTSALYFT